jgi:phospholipid/cholesterol/gamma-HCH transport system substrate-binding protein
MPKLAAKDLQAFTADLNRGLDDVDKILEAVNPDDIKKVVAGAGAVGEMLEKRTPDLDKLISSSTSAMDNIDEITATIRNEKDAIAEVIEDGRVVINKVDTIVSRGVEIVEAVQPEQVSKIVGNVETFSADLNSTLASVDEIVANVDPEKVGRGG